jgi:hypothetical protein
MRFGKTHWISGMIHASYHWTNCDKEIFLITVEKGWKITIFTKKDHFPSLVLVWLTMWGVRGHGIVKEARMGWSSIPWTPFNFGQVEFY